MALDELSTIQEIEDFLHEQKIFANPFTGNPCHMDSYGTLVNFDKLETVIPAFTKEQWKIAVEYWTDNPNNQPPARMVAFTVRRKLNL